LTADLVDDMKLMVFTITEVMMVLPAPVEYSIMSVDIGYGMPQPSWAPILLETSRHHLK
jgi:hypothetical protein